MNRKAEMELRESIIEQVHKMDAVTLQRLSAFIAALETEVDRQEGEEDDSG